MTHDPVADRIARERIQQVINLRRWDSLTVTKRRELVDLIRSHELSDKEIFTLYKRTSKEAEICISSEIAA